MVTQSDANNVSDIEDTNKDKVECIYLSQTIKKSPRQLFSITEHVTTFSAREGRRRNNVCYVIYFLKGGVLFDCFTIVLCSTL